MGTATSQGLNAATVGLSKILINAPLPHNEPARLEALYKCKILDTAAETTFDDITRLAAYICGTPIALVNLIDASRQWFKSKVGIDTTEMPRDVAFCAHTILQPDILIVTDTLTDERFATNPLVTSDPYIRFYAGVPLITSEGYALGTLCAIDYVPRELDLEQVEALRTLGRQVIKLLEVRCNLGDLEGIAAGSQPAQKQRQRFFKRIAVGFGLASAILATVGLVSYRNLTSFIQTANWQIQHYKVHQELEDISFQMQKAAIAQNRYITTREARYLQPYYDATQVISQKIVQLRKAMANRPDQKQRLDTLESQITKKFAEIEQTTNLLKNREFKAGQLAFLTQKAKILTDDIEAEILQLETAENMSLIQASFATETRAQNTIFTFYSGIFLNFFILAGVYYFIYREMASRKRTEAALEQERDFTAAVLDTVGALVVVLDSQGRIVRCNRACEQRTGYSLAEVKGKHFWDLFLTPEEVVTQKAVFQELRGDQFPNQYESYWVTRKGDRRLIAWSNTTLLDKNGFVEYIISTGIDITERKWTEEALEERTTLKRAILDSANYTIISTTVDGTICTFNAAAERWLGYSALEVVGKTTPAIFHDEDELVRRAQELSAEMGVRINPGFEVLFANARRGEADEHEWSYIRKDGSRFPVLLSVTAVRDAEDNITGFLGIGSDITERKQSQEALQQANENLTGWVNELEQRNREIALLGEMSDVLQACLTVEEAYSAIATLVQPLFPQTSGGIFLLGTSKNLVEAVATWGSPALLSQEMFTPHDCWALRRGLAHWVEDTDNGLLCKHLHHALPAESLCLPMMAQGEALGVLYLGSLEKGQLTPTKQQLASTVSEHIALALGNLKLRQTLQNQSIRDPLTGLFNRRYLEESLERELHRCERKQQSLGIIMVDVDHFKRFNDTFGHEAGDAVLRELGLFLQKHIRKSDIACRYGGEELTLILPEASLNVVRQRAEQLRQGAKHLQVQHRHQLLGAITLSLGVACFPEHGTTGEAVIQAADAALYRAKAEGRDAVRLAP